MELAEVVLNRCARQDDAAFGPQSLEHCGSLVTCALQTMTYRLFLSSPEAVHGAIGHTLIGDDKSNRRADRISSNSSKRTGVCVLAIREVGTRHRVELSCDMKEASTCSHYGS